MFKVSSKNPHYYKDTSYKWAQKLLFYPDSFSNSWSGVDIAIVDRQGVDYGILISNLDGVLEIDLNFKIKRFKDDQTHKKLLKDIEQDQQQTYESYISCVGVHFSGGKPSYWYERRKSVGYVFSKRPKRTVIHIKVKKGDYLVLCLIDRDYDENELNPTIATGSAYFYRK